MAQEQKRTTFTKQILLSLSLIGVLAGLGFWGLSWYQSTQKLLAPKSDSSASLSRDAEELNVTMLSCCCPDKNKTKRFKERADDPCKLQTQPTKEQLKTAKIAWEYIQNNFNEQTGLINSADNYPSASVWDWSNGIYAIYAAKKFGFISQERFEEMINSFLSTMQKMEIFNNELPNKTYNTKSAKMTDYNNNARPDGIGWSVNDIARLLASLNVIQQCEENLVPAIDKLILRYHYCRALSVDGSMYGASYENGTIRINQETLTGYEEYAARSFEHWGFDLTEAKAYKFVKEVSLYGVKVPTETREFYSAFLGSESFWYTGFDYGVDDNESGAYIKSIYEVQKARYLATSQFTAITEDNLDQAPYFVYNTIYEDSEPWKALTQEGRDYDEFKSVSTKAAIGMRMLFDSNYTQKLFDYIDSNYDEKRGYYAGIYEKKAGKNKVLTLNTNAVILESLLFKNMGPLQKIRKVQSRAGYDYYRNHINNFRCLPREENLTVLAPYNAKMNLSRIGSDEKRAIKKAWEYFEQNYHPQTGVVNGYDHYNMVSMMAVAKTIMGELSANALGLMPQALFQERIEKLLTTLKVLPLYNNELPNKFYDANTMAITGSNGWNMYEIAQTITALYHLQQYHPQYRQDVVDILSRWKFDRAIQTGVKDAQIDNGTQENLYALGDIGKEYYVHSAFSLIGYNTYSHLLDERHLAYKPIYEYEVPASHWAKRTNAESYLWTMLELPYFLKYQHFSSNIYLAQKERYTQTGKWTTSSEEHLDQAPYGLVSDIYNHNSHWVDFDQHGNPLDDFTMYSTKVAFIYDALYGYSDTYAPLLRKEVEKLQSSVGGWYSGYYRKFDRKNRSLTLLTNSAILESVWYKKVGNFYYYQHPKSLDRVSLHKPLHLKGRYSIVSPEIKLFVYAKMLLERFKESPVVRIERQKENYVVLVGAYESREKAEEVMQGLNLTLYPETFKPKFFNDTNDTTFRIEKREINSDKFLLANRYYAYDYRLPYQNRLMEDEKSLLSVPYKGVEKKNPSPL